MPHSLGSRSVLVRSMTGLGEWERAILNVKVVGSEGVCRAIDCHRPRPVPVLPYYSYYNNNLAKWGFGVLGFWGFGEIGRAHV